MNTMAMHSRLLKHIQEQEDCRVHYEGLQDKITQVKKDEDRDCDIVVRAFMAKKLWVQIWQFMKAEKISFTHHKMAKNEFSLFLGKPE